MVRQLIAAIMLAAGPPAIAAPPPLAKGGVDCIAQSRIRDQRTVPPHTIYYKVDGRWFRNDFDNACPRLDRFRATVTRTPSSNLCVGDLVSVVDLPSRINYGSCPIRSFVEVPGPAKAQ